MQVNKGMEQLRSILSQAPGSDTWEELIECLDNWSDIASLSAAVDYAEQQLADWQDDDLRTAPSGQFQAIQNGAPLPRWWKLVRHIEMGENDQQLTVLSPEVLENLTSIELQDDCIHTPEELRFLASLNKLGAVYWGDLMVSLSLANCPADEPIDDILDAAEQQLSNLPDEERTVSEEYWADIRVGKISIPRWWKLVRHLELGEDDEEISPIEAFTNLTSLNISNCHLIDISPLAEITNLTSLTLVKDLAPFSIEPLSHLTRLVSLRLAVAELTNVDELAELKNLEKLDLSYGYDLTSIDGLVSLKKLTWLSLEECRKLKDLTPLSQLTALKYLNLSNCTSITDVSALAQLNQLKFLDLAGCEVLSDLTPLGNLTTLKEVRLDGDFITNLATLTNLKQVNGRRERLRYILSQDPGSDTWEKLIECLDNWSDFASLSAAVDYAEQQLTTWPDYRRTAPSRQCQAIQEGAPLPRWWKLIRHIELGEDDNSLTLPSPEVLENLTYIELKDDRIFLPEELRLLASFNKLDAVDWDDLIVSLETCPADEPIDDILDSAQQQLSYLPDENRTVSEKYWAGIREGKISIPRWWKLVRHLELGENDGELLPIEAFTNLTSLDISYCNLIDISPLAEFTNLTSLKLMDDFMAFGIEPLSHLTQLRSLRLALPELTHINELAELKNLEELDLSYRYDLTNIDGLRSLKKLTLLNLYECPELTDLTPLSQLTALRKLILRDCKSITDISPLVGLNQLQLLDLAGCEALSDLTPLGNLTTLKQLYLGGDSITNLAILTNLKQLESLNLINCRALTDISPLQELTSLRKLSLGGCKALTDFSPLATLQNCSIFK